MSYVFSFGLIAIVALCFMTCFFRFHKRLVTLLPMLLKQISKQSIDELRSVSIGGLQQWLHIRGCNTDNPILLVLHGGPGASHIGWFDEIQRPWENHFTVVQWDQRQAGKSYAPIKQVSASMNNAQMISDAKKVVAYLREQFQHEKIFIMGTSYGTYLGMHLVKSQPKSFYAYVAIGQVVNMMEHASKEHEKLLDYAKESGDTLLARKLSDISPFPDPDNKSASFLANVGFIIDQQSLLGKCFPMSLSDLGKIIAIKKMISPLYSWRDRINLLFGDKPALHCAKCPFAEDFMGYNLPVEVGSELEAPIFFFTGIDDWHVSSEMTDQWFQRIQSPFKEQVWFKQSAHAPYLTEPYAFAKALVEKVHPFSQGDILARGQINE